MWSGLYAFDGLEAQIDARRQNSFGRGLQGSKVLSLMGMGEVQKSDTSHTKGG